MEINANPKRLDLNAETVRKYPNVINNQYRRTSCRPFRLGNMEQLLKKDL